MVDVLFNIPTIYEQHTNYILTPRYILGISPVIRACLTLKLLDGIKIIDFTDLT